MWKLHQKNIALTLSSIRTEKVFLVIWEKGIRLMSTDGHFSRYLHSPERYDYPQHDPAVCVLGAKSDLLEADLIHLQNSLVNAGVLDSRLPIPVSLAIYNREIDILGPNLESAIAEIVSRTNTAGESGQPESVRSYAKSVR